MTKRAVFLHGTDGDPTHHWWPWLKQQFEQSGYEVWTPVLPNNHTPNRTEYWDFLTTKGWGFNDNVIVGHSSGATTVLNLLARSEFPKVKAAVLVGAFLNQNLTSKLSDFETDQFAQLFPEEGFDLSIIKKKADSFYFVHGDNDGYCSYDDAVDASRALGGKMITVKNGGHLTSSYGTELPQLTDALAHDNIL